MLVSLYELLSVCLSSIYGFRFTMQETHHKGLHVLTLFFNIDEWTQVLIATSLYISSSFLGKYVSYAKPVLLKDR